MAISPTISLGRVSKSTSNLRSVVSQSGKATNVIKNTLTSNLSKKRNLWNSTKIFKTRRQEFDRRKVQKDLLTSPSILSRRGGASLLSQQDKSTSITDRLLGFVKYLTAGWLLGNLPTWINYGEQFVGRLGTAGSILSNYGDETLAVMKSIGGIFSSALKNLSTFDFTDNSGLMRTSIGELTSALDNLGTGLSDALDVLFAPFKELPAEPKEEPTPPTPPGTPAPSGGNSDFWTLVAVVSREDSDPQGQADVAQSIYNRARSGKFPGGTSIRNIILARKQYQPTRERPKVNPSEDTNPEWYQIKDAKSAAKAADFDEATIKGVARNITNPTLQKEAAKFVAGRTDFKGASIGKSPSIQRKSGDNWFGWEYGYRGTTVAPVPNFGVTQTPAPQSPTPTSLRNFAAVSGTSGRGMGNRKVSLPYSPTRPGSGVEITSVMGQRYGREHTGWDLAGNAGTPLYAYFPGVVTHENRVPPRYAGDREHGAGYGYWIIWKDDVYGSYHFFGHMLKPAEVRKGQKFQQGALLGYIGSTGRSTGPHLHWEISNTSPKSNGEFTSRQDVNAWLKSHPLKAAQPAQISSTAVPTTPLVPASPQLTEDQETTSEMQTNANQTGLRGAMVQERRGQKIIIVDDRGTQIPQTVMTSSGDTLSIQIDESALLNNFMRNKLLLDLNYV